MRKLKVFLSLTLLTSVLPGTAWAEVKPNGLRLEEIVKALQSSPSPLDWNGDGKVTEQEVTGVLGQLQTQNVNVDAVRLGYLSGYVQDDEGRAVPGAQVTLEGIPGMILTDDLGYFKTPALPVSLGKKVTVSKDGYWPAAPRPFAVLADQTTSLGHLVLSKQYGSVTGTVYSPDGAVVSGAAVEVGGVAGRTGDRGQFALVRVPAGTQSITVNSSVYGIRVETIQVPVSGNADISIHYSAPAGVGVKGQVVSDDGTPVNNATVTVVGSVYAATTNDQGIFSLLNLPKGTFDFRIAADGYQPKTVYGVSVTAGVYDAGVIRLTPAEIVGDVSVQVSDLNGAALAGATVTLTNGMATYRSETNSAGIVELTGVPTGEYTLTASHPDYRMSQPQQVTVVKGIHSTVPFKLEPRFGTISGVVYDDANDVLVEAKVVLLAEDGSYEAAVYSDNQGAFRFDHVPPNVNYMLLVNKKGYFTPNLPAAFKMNPGHTLMLDPKMTKGETVTTAAEFVRALMNANISTLFIPVDISLPSPVVFQRSVRLTGPYGQTRSIRAPHFEIANAAPNPVVSWSDLELIAAVGDNESGLITSHQSFVHTIEVSNMGGYSGIARRVPTTDNTDYFVSEGSSNLTAFVHSSGGLKSALANEQVSKIYIADNIVMNEEELNFPSRPVTLVSNTPKVIDTYAYSGSTNVTLTNVSLLEHLPPQLLYLSATSAYADEQTALQVKTDKDATVHLVRDSYPVNSIDDLYEWVTRGEISFFRPKLSPGVSTYTNVTAHTYGDLSTMGLEPGIYRLYTVSHDYRLSGTLAAVTVLPDITHPLLSSVTTGPVSLGTPAITATSSEAGYLYLVPVDTNASIDEITARKAAMAAAAAGSATELPISHVPQGDYKVYAVDLANNISSPSADIQIRKTPVQVMADIRQGLSYANRVSLTLSDLLIVGLTGVVQENVDLYQYAFTLDRDALQPLGDAQLLEALQNWVTIANAAPAIHRALKEKVSSPYLDWSAVSIATFNNYGISGVQTASELAVAKTVLEHAFVQGNYKLLPLAAIQAAVNAIEPQAAQSGWAGTGAPLGRGTRQVQLAINLKNSANLPLKGYTAEDFTVQVNGTEYSLGNTSVFPEFYYDDTVNMYKVVFQGGADGTNFVLSHLTAHGTVIQDASSPITVITPLAAIPLTSFTIGIPGGATHVPAGSYSTIYPYFNPYNATNQALSWSVTPADLASINEYGGLMTYATGEVTVTATHLQSGLKATMVVGIVDQAAALAKVKAFARSGGTTELTAQDLINTCIPGVVADALDIYKQAILAKAALLTDATGPTVYNITESIIRDFSQIASLNRALYELAGGDGTSWAAIGKDQLMANGIYYVDHTNVSSVKQVLHDAFMNNGGAPMDRTTALNLAARVPSTNIQSFNPTVYFTEVKGFSLGGDGSNVIMKFRIANIYNEGITNLTAQDVKAKIAGTVIPLDHASYFTNFTNLGGGQYSVEVLSPQVGTPLKIESLLMRIGFTDVPFITNISVNKQAVLIEKAAATRNWAGLDSGFFAAGGFPSVSSLEWHALTYSLEQAYTAHGQVLTEASIRRIINGLQLFISLNVSDHFGKDTYRMTFGQSVSGSAYYSFNARVASGFLYRSSAGGSGNTYSVQFNPNTMSPVVLIYKAEGTDKLTFGDGTDVPDFELVYVPTTY